MPMNSLDGLCFKLPFTMALIWLKSYSIDTVNRVFFNTEDEAINSLKASFSVTMAL